MTNGSQIQEKVHSLAFAISDSLITQLIVGGSYPQLGYPNASGKNAPWLDSTSEIKPWHSQIIIVGYMTSKIDKSVCLSIQNHSQLY